MYFVCIVCMFACVRLQILVVTSVTCVVKTGVYFFPDDVTPIMASYILVFTVTMYLLSGSFYLYRLEGKADVSLNRNRHARLLSNMRAQLHTCVLKMLWYATSTLVPR